MRPVGMWHDARAAGKLDDGQTRENKKMIGITGGINGGGGRRAERNATTALSSSPSEDAVFIETKVGNEIG